MAKSSKRRFAKHQVRRREIEDVPVVPAPPREEGEILRDIRALCHTRGFAHIVANAIVRDNFIFYSGEMKPGDMANLFGHNRLIRTEIATLIGYMVQPGSEAFDGLPEDPQNLLGRIEAALEELHRRLGAPMFEGITTDENGAIALIKAHEQGQAMREPIFYGGESAFNFQYLDFAVDKYRADNPWLEANYGFSIEEAAALIGAGLALMEEQVTACGKAASPDDPDSWSLLPGFLVNEADLIARSGLAPERAKAVIAAFETPLSSNAEFVSLHDFNHAVSYPLITLGDGRIAIFQNYAPAEALYEAPFYWMYGDKAYRDTASGHRGDFTEAYTYQRLIDVFGVDYVYRNLNLDRGKGKRVGEIDILVEFGGRIILVQAKSKRLTLEARRGDERRLRSDFKAAVQEAYDQAFLCAEALLDPTIQITTAAGEQVFLRHPPSKIYPLCLVSDHYPGLVAQTERFLVKHAVDKVAQPIVTDIFALDVLCELLDRPLRLLGYCELRDRFNERLIYSHELVLLACHVRQNLWIDDKFGGMMLSDTINAPVEIAMLVRRRNIPGERTPRGPLTMFAGTPFDGMLRRIEGAPEPPLVELAMRLLEASGATIKQFNDGIEFLVAQTNRDLRPHDISMLMDDEGLTIHCSYEPPEAVFERLEAHVEARKYACRASRWFGLFVDPADGLPLVGLVAAFPWEYDPVRAEVAAALPQRRVSNNLPQSLKRLVQATPRPNPKANGSCPCGSGQKFKRCCGS